MDRNRTGIGQKLDRNRTGNRQTRNGERTGIQKGESAQDAGGDYNVKGSKSLCSLRIIGQRRAYVLCPDLPVLYE